MGDSATWGEQTQITPSGSGLRPADRLTKGELVSRYVVLDRLGAGGMGVVYAAYDPELDRKVALKLLHRDTARGASEGRRRLLREAQAMARLNHPGVVTVHDVGEHDGRIFIAMEYVDGLTVGAWLKQHRPPWRDVLDVYLRAGAGLAAAHALGIIHRDLKPENIMVGLTGGVIDRVRVTDFGIARPVTESSPDTGSSRAEEMRPRVDAFSSELTADGSVMGTPAYMAPEQKKRDPIDERADQYSLCLALWEGLYGERPFAGDTPASFTAEQLAGHFRSPPRNGVPAEVRAALERGLAPEASDRHASVDALLAQLQLKPAAPRTLLLAGGVVVTVGVGAAAWVLWSDTQRQRACTTLGDAIHGDWDDDARARVRARLLDATPGEGGRTADAVESRLDAFAQAWATARTKSCASGENPRVEAATACFEDQRIQFAALVSALGDSSVGTWWQGVDATTNLPILSQCEDEAWLRQQAALPEDEAVRAEVVELKAALGRHRARSGMARPEDAVREASTLLERAQATAWPPVVAHAYATQAGALKDAGRYDDAASSSAEAYFLALAAGDDLGAARAAEQSAALIGYFLGRHTEGLLWARTALTLWERVGQEESVMAAPLLGTMGLIRVEMGDRAQALDDHEQMRARWEAAVGPEHPEVARARNNIGLALTKMGRLLDAREQFELALQIWERAVGPHHPEVATVLNNLGNTYLGLSQLDEAEANYQRALNVRAAALGEDHPIYASTATNLASTLHKRGEFERARPLFERALASLEASLGPKHARVGMVLGNLAPTLTELHEYDAAHGVLQRALGIFQDIDADHPMQGVVLINLADLAAQQGNHAEAQRYYVRAVEATAALGDEHPHHAFALAGLGAAQVELERFDEAVSNLERAAAIRVKIGVAGDELAATFARLVLALRGAGAAPEHIASVAAQARQTASQDGLAAIEELLGSE